MIKAIVVDDEPIALEQMQLLLKKYCNTELKVVGVANSVETAVKLIAIHDPELIFLDIELGPRSGFQLLEQLPNLTQQIIFTTAYDKYALQAIKCNAIDYLLKPIDPQELQIAVAKVKNHERHQQNQKIDNLLQFVTEPNNPNNKIIIPHGKGTAVYTFNEIVFMEAQQEYTYVHTQDNVKLCSTYNLGKYEEMLPNHLFFRQHHSFIINRQHILEFHKTPTEQVKLKNEILLPVSRRRKAEFLAWLILK